MKYELEHYTTLKPLNSQLHGYIAYYYFDYSDKEDNQKRYIFYPHYKNALTIYKNSRVSFGKNSSTVLFDTNKEFEIIYTGIQTESRFAKINTPFNKVGIVFQPLGLNNFLGITLSEITVMNPKANFNYFGNTFEKVLKEVFEAKKDEEKVSVLDAFFVNQLNPFTEKRLIEALDLIFDQELSIQELSHHLKINRKTLFRLFKKHLNCSPKEFATIVKFRKALNLYHSKENKPQLTEVAYLNDYYDQSDFIKNFKKVTGFNPKKFFLNISHLGNQDTFWTIMD